MNTDVQPEPRSRRPAWQRGFRVLAITVLAVALALGFVWAAAALYMDVRVAWLRVPSSLVFVMAILAAWLWPKWRPRAPWATLGGILLVMLWWSTLRASNSRDWQPDLALLASAEIQGDQVTVRNIRHCHYRTETDFDVRHYDKTFDLRALRSADLYMVYWGSPHMAHTMVSFGFEGGDYLCFSIETRKEKGEGYSAAKGLFRQFELIYVVADERDVVGLRTNFRKGEEVYLFRLNASREQIRTLFLDYLRRVNSLKDRPEWYSALTENCTTGIRNQRTIQQRAPWDWRMLVNGHGDKLLYEHGAIVTNLALAEVKRLGHVNARAQAAGEAADFSQQIRQGVPGMP